MGSIGPVLRTRPLLVLLPVAIIGAFASCISEPANETKTKLSAVILPAVNFTVALRTPKGVPLVSIALGADGPETIGGATQIIRPGGVLSRTTNVGAGGISADPDAVLGDVFSTSTVTLRDRVRVLGTVHAPGVV